MYQIIKTCLDRVFALLLLLLLSPVFVGLSIWIRRDSPGPAFFKQSRVGRRKISFQMFKFRTMYIQAPSKLPTHLLKDPERYITKPGRILRRTSLDELPQLINILRGEMSFVGPRPALQNQYDLLEMREANGANELHPGLTGWAQVNGRDALGNSQKAEYDGVYAKKFGFWMDILCVCKTISGVLFQKGILEGEQNSTSQGLEK